MSIVKMRNFYFQYCKKTGIIHPINLEGRTIKELEKEYKLFHNQVSIDNDLFYINLMECWKNALTNEIRDRKICIVLQ
jgi:hypothetical protein